MATQAGSNRRHGWLRDSRKRNSAVVEYASLAMQHRTSGLSGSSKEPNRQGVAWKIEILP